MLNLRTRHVVVARGPPKKILLDFNAKVGKEDIFKPTIGNKSLHEISNDNGVTTTKPRLCLKLEINRSGFYCLSHPARILHSERE
jgi:hypothetical protein